MNALERLAAAIGEDRPDWPPVRCGGAVSATTANEIRVVGLANRAAIGDVLEIDDERGEGLLAEIVRVEPEGLLAKPLHGRGRPRLGAIAWLRPPIAIAPDLGWIGRVVDALGAPIDGAGALPRGGDRPVAAAPPTPLSRPSPTEALRTGIRAIDLFTPLVHGQRVGVFAGTGVGKSTLLAMMAAVADFDVAVLALTGERGREVRGLLHGPLSHCRARTVTVVATADETAMRRRLAPMTAMTIAESFRDAGMRVLLVVDSLTRMAHAMRERALAVGEMPVARGYPPSLLAELPAFLERAGTAPTGSITGLFAVLVDGDDRNDPIADVARGTLDGHIVLDRRIAESGRYPAIDLLASLSRLAEAVWTREQRALVGRLRSMIASYEDSRDLRLLSGQAAEADPVLQQAVELVPRIYEVLQQSPEDPPSGDVYAELAAMLRQQPARPR